MAHQWPAPSSAQCRSPATHPPTSSFFVRAREIDSYLAGRRQEKFDVIETSQGYDETLRDSGHATPHYSGFPYRVASRFVLLLWLSGG